MTEKTSVSHSSLLLIISGFITSLICISTSYIYYLYGIIYIMIIPYILIIVYSLVPLFDYTHKLNKNPTERPHLNFIFTYTLMMTSLTLILSTSFAQSPYHVFGYDINRELYFASNVAHTHYWDLSIKHPYNSVVSITLLLPMLSVLSHVNIEALLKIVYPILYGFTFLILYRLYSMRLNVVLGYSSTLIILYLFVSFTELLALGRQMIAEFLLALFIFFIIRSLDTHKFSNILASIIMLVGISFSHYAIAFIFSFILLAGIILLRIIPSIMSRHDATTLKHGAYELPAYIFLITTFVWYNNVAQGISIFNLLEVIKSTINYVSELLNPMYSQAYAYIAMPTTLSREIARSVLLITVSVISLGVIVEILHQVRNRVNGYWRHYLTLFVLPFFMLNSVAVILPLISNTLNTTRLLQLSLIVLSLYFGVGYEFLGGKVIESFSRRRQNRLTHDCTIRRLHFLLLLIFLILYAISNTGVLSIVMNDHVMPQWLNPIASPSWKQAEVFFATWLISNFEDPDNTLIYTYEYNFPLFLRFEKVNIMIVQSQRTNIEVNNAKIKVFFSGRTIDAYGYFPELNYFGSAPVLQLTPCLSHFICRELIRSSTILSTEICSVYLITT